MDVSLEPVTRATLRAKAEAAASTKTFSSLVLNTPMIWSSYEGHLTTPNHVCLILYQNQDCITTKRRNDLLDIDCNLRHSRFRILGVAYGGIWHSDRQAMDWSKGG